MRLFRKIEIDFTPYIICNITSKKNNNKMTSFVKQYSKEIGTIIKNQVKRDGLPTNMDLEKSLYTTTDKVSKKTIQELENKVGIKAQKIKIIPLFRERLCHNNTEELRKISGGEHVLGYNITSCYCGKHYSLEIHSVLKWNGEYIDLTKDFAHEKEKWFLPVYTFDESDFRITFKIKFLYWQMKEALFVFSWNGEHNCDSRRTFIADDKYPLEVEEAVGAIWSLNKIHPFLKN